MKHTLQNKLLGGLLGTAVGDAIGELAFVNRSRSTLSKAIQQAQVLEYTDDTIMTIGLTEAIISCNGKILPEKVGETFHKHYKQDPARGYGTGPPTIFRTIEHSKKSYVKTAKTLFNGEGSYGNGAAMRITPVGLYFHDTDNIYTQAKKSAIPTHAHKLGIEGAALLAKLISILVKKQPNTHNINQEQQNILHTLLKTTKTSKYTKKLKKAQTLLQQETSLDHAVRKLGSGEKVTALDSVPFVIFAFLHNPSSFQDTLLNTVIHSGDADTIGAMLGGTLGTYHGHNTIPDTWKQKIENIQHIQQLATKLATLKSREQSLQ